MSEDHAEDSVWDWGADGQKKPLSASSEVAEALFRTVEANRAVQNDELMQLGAAHRPTSLFPAMRSSKKLL